MDECRLVREDVEYAISLIEHRPEQDTVDYKVFDVLNEAHEQLKRMELLLKEQQPKTGHWMFLSGTATANGVRVTSLKCSECGERTDRVDTDRHVPFCPMCGAKMEE